jgi:L-ascorbate oxidase
MNKNLLKTNENAINKDGVFGSLIIRQPNKTNIQASLYDHDLPEHVIIINDWFERPLQDLYASFLHDQNYFLVNSILINGRGKAPRNELQFEPPLAEFRVRRGHKYRFRLINAGSDFCTMSVSIDGHNLTVISLDGFDVQPVLVESISFDPGTLHGQSFPFF